MTGQLVDEIERLRAEVARLETAGDKLAEASDATLMYLDGYGSEEEELLIAALAGWREVHGQTYPDADTTVGEENECPGCTDGDEG